MTAELQTALAAILGAFGTLVLKEWIPGAVRWFTGRSARQKSLLKEAEAARETAEDERDQEAFAKRLLEVHCTALTRYLVEAGWDPSDPQLRWPKYGRERNQT